MSLKMLSRKYRPFYPGLDVFSLHYNQGKLQIWKYDILLHFDINLLLSNWCGFYFI